MTEKELRRLIKITTKHYLNVVSADDSLTISLNKCIENGHIFMISEDMYEDYLTTLQSTSSNWENFEQWAEEVQDNLPAPYDQYIVIVYGKNSFDSEHIFSLWDISDADNKQTISDIIEIDKNNKVKLVGEQMTQGKATSLGFVFLKLINTVKEQVNLEKVPNLNISLSKKREKKNFPQHANSFIPINKFTGTGNSLNISNGVRKARHWVRGHFKKRKTGVFWWKPHLAGSGELKTKSGYKLN